jgi:hypothetical protein
MARMLMPSIQLSVQKRVDSPEPIMETVAAQNIATTTFSFLFGKPAEVRF